METGGGSSWQIVDRQDGILPARVESKSRAIAMGLFVQEGRHTGGLAGRNAACPSGQNMQLVWLQHRNPRETPSVSPAPSLSTSLYLSLQRP